jgi:spore coat polysaccharide biosynthesis protein SpsF (cytidylyltransferase family)
LPALAIVQARMSSSRLPGKSLAEIEGEPALALLVRRLSRAAELDEVMVATSVEPDDDPVAEVAAGLGCRVHRGPRDDVLARFVGAAEDYDGTIVRITADCPLADPAVIDEVVRLLHATPSARYASNVEPRSFPVGLDAEAFAADTLRAADRAARDPELREHVTLVMRRDAGRFPHATVRCREDLSALRWTVDEADDLEFVRRVAERLGPRRHEADMWETLEAVRREPSLAEFRGRRG